MNAAFVEDVALRVVELLEERGLVAEQLVGPDVVAQRLNVERSWVYEHADELGVRRLGSGPKAPLRFNMREVEAAISCLTGRESEQPAERTAKPTSRRRQPYRLGTGAELLHIKSRGAVDGGRRSSAVAALRPADEPPAPRREDG